MTVRTLRIAAALAALSAAALGSLEWHYITPSPRSLATIVIDTLNQRAVLFGGGSGGSSHSDVWEMPLDSATGYGWTVVSVSGSPPAPRAGHAAIFDPGQNRMVVFGGREGYTVYSDVWALDLATTTWTQLNPSGTPPPGRVYITGVYCPARRSMIIFDGSDVYQGYNAVYELLLDSLKWHEMTPAGTPPEARWSYNVFMDPDSNRLIVFGGQTQSGQFEDDVWALTLGSGTETWTELDPTGAIPEGRSNCATGYDEASRRAYFFGGFNYNAGVFYNDLYTLDMNTLTWTNASPGGITPTERRCATGLFDPWNRNFFCFGGQTYDGFSCEGFYVSVGALGIANWQGLEPDQPPWLQVTSVNSDRVSIRFFTPRPVSASLKLVDQSGRVVRSLLSGSAAQGRRELVWDGKDDAGTSVPAGSYFCRLEMEETQLSKKFVIAR